MGVGPRPRPAQDGSDRERGAGDDVGPSDRLLDILRDADRLNQVGQQVGRAAIPTVVPDFDMLDRPHGAVRRTR